MAKSSFIEVGNPMCQVLLYHPVSGKVGHLPALSHPRLPEGFPVLYPRRQSTLVSHLLPAEHRGPHSWHLAPLHARKGNSYRSLWHLFSPTLLGSGRARAALHVPRPSLQVDEAPSTAEGAPAERYGERPGDRMSLADPFLQRHVQCASVSCDATESAASEADQRTQ